MESPYNLTFRDSIYLQESEVNNMPSFMEQVLKALENQEPTEEIMKDATGAGDPDLQTQTDAIDSGETGNAGSPGDDAGNPVGHPDPDQDPSETELASQDRASEESPSSPGDPGGNPDPDSASEGFVGMFFGDKRAPAPAPAAEGDGYDTSIDSAEGNFKGFNAEVGLHKNRNQIPLQQEKDAKDASGNTGDPAENKQTPVTPSGDTKPVHLDQAILDSYDKSGNTGSPGVNGTPVSKSGDSKPLAKNEFEQAADDKSGNPDSPGEEGNPRPSFENFISALEQHMIKPDLGVVNIPESMSLEAFALELGYGQIAAMAMEAKLTAAEKKALKDSDFGLPGERKWPIHDPEHVKSAIYNFHWCPKAQQPELAKNILKAIRKFGMKEVQVTEGNPFLKYYPGAKVVPRKKPTKKAK